MAGQINTNEFESINNAFLSPSPPVLPSSLNVFYNGLDSFNRGVFVKIFRYLWRYVNLRSVRRAELVSSYWLLYGCIDRSGVPASSFALLSYIYYMTNKGNSYIHSDNIYYSGVLPGLIVHSNRCMLTSLGRAGYLIRSTKDPGQPYNHKAQHNKQPVFVRLSPAGIKLIEGIEKDINRLLLNTSLNDLTGVNKKPG